MSVACVLHHAIECLPARVLEQLGVLSNLAADQRTEGRADVARQAAAADDEAEDLALGLHDAVAGHEGRGDDDHATSITDGA
jgi:hypothetical protein